MSETYGLLGVDAKDVVTLEKYLQDYFTNILKKLKDMKAQSKQSDIYFWRIPLRIGAWSCSVRIDLFDTMFCITPLCKKEKREEYSHSFIKKFASLWYILFILCARKTTLKAMDRDGGKVCRSGVSGLLIQIMGSGKFVNQIWPIIILGTKIVRRVGPAPLYSSYKTPQKRGGGAEEGANWLIVYQLFGHIFPLGNYFGDRFEHICIQTVRWMWTPGYHVGTRINWIILGTLYPDLYSGMCL